MYPYQVYIGKCGALSCASDMRPFFVLLDTNGLRRSLELALWTWLLLCNPPRQLIPSEGQTNLWPMIAIFHAYRIAMALYLVDTVRHAHAARTMQCAAASRWKEDFTT